jgi:hypothetical protein
MVMAGTSVRITCSSEQAEKLLSVKEILDGSVVVSRPRGSGKASVQWTKGVIKKVPHYLDISDIMSDSGVVWAHRIMSNKGKEKQPTRVVILAFPAGKKPETVSIGLSDYRLQTYIPLPVRCAKCQRFGHKIAACTAKTATCSKCGEKHDAVSCNTAKVTCVNCNGNHSAGYRGCPKYQTISHTLITSAKTGLLYSEALKRTKERERKKLAGDAGSRTTATHAEAVPAKADTSVGISVHTASQPRGKAAVKTAEVSVQTDDCSDACAQTEPASASHATDMQALLPLMLEMLKWLVESRSTGSLKGPSAARQMRYLSSLDKLVTHTNQQHATSAAAASGAPPARPWSLNNGGSTEARRLPASPKK